MSLPSPGEYDALTLSHGLQVVDAWEALWQGAHHALRGRQLAHDAKSGPGRLCGAGGACLVSSS